MQSRRAALKTIAAGAAALVPFRAARAQAAAALKDAYKDAFLVGTCPTPQMIRGEDERGAALVRAQFNSATPGNCLKWDSVHPQPDRYNFDLPDRFVGFAEQNGMHAVGHTLVWHSQVPGWVFQNAEGQPISHDMLLARLRAHILRVVGRYKGRIKTWDVVNEVIDESGSLRQSPWFKLSGVDYIAAAFVFAHEADPGAELVYNDYGLENPGKRAGALGLVKALKEAGVPITTVGIQGHYLLDWPSAASVDAAIADFARLGVKVAVTELDIDVLPRPSGKGSADINLSFGQSSALDPYVDGLPDSVQSKLARRYADMFAVFRKHRDVLDRVTLWGVTDADGWLNDWPIHGRTNYGLLFDRAYQPKPAFHAVIEAAGG